MDHVTEKLGVSERRACSVITPTGEYIITPQNINFIPHKYYRLIQKPWKESISNYSGVIAIYHRKLDENTAWDEGYIILKHSKNMKRNVILQKEVPNALGDTISTSWSEVLKTQHLTLCSVLCPRISAISASVAPFIAKYDAAECRRS